MSAHDEWQRQRDLEAAGGRQRAGRPLPKMEVGHFEGITLKVGSIPVEAVPLLLAVAKAAEAGPRGESEETFCPICRNFSWAGHEPDCLYAQLDGAHSGWREWA